VVLHIWLFPCFFFLYKMSHGAFGESGVARTSSSTSISNSACSHCALIREPRAACHAVRTVEVSRLRSDDWRKKSAKRWLKKLRNFCNIVFQIHIESKLDFLTRSRDFSVSERWYCKDSIITRALYKPRTCSSLCEHVQRQAWTIGAFPLTRGIFTNWQGECAESCRADPLIRFVARQVTS